MTNFLLLHGWGGKANEHWLSYLENRLKEEGVNVYFPNFGPDEYPIRKEWVDKIDEIVSKIEPSELVVVGHSLGPIAWLHYLTDYPKVQPKRIFFIAPPLTNNGYPQLDDFFPIPDLDLKDQAGHYQIIGSDNDSFIKKEEFEELAASLKISFHFIPNSGHFNISSGHGKWPWIEEQCIKLL